MIARRNATGGIHPKRSKSRTIYGQSQKSLVNRLDSEGPSDFKSVGQLITNQKLGGREEVLVRVY
jgi:hypothetical protein